MHARGSPEGWPLGPALPDSEEGQVWVHLGLGLVFALHWQDCLFHSFTTVKKQNKKTSAESTHFTRKKQSPVEGIVLSWEIPPHFPLCDSV